METLPTGLVAVITHYLTERHISGRQFAVTIGIDPGHWSRIRRGVVPPGGRFLKAVAAGYPDLAPAVASYFTGVEVVA
jgi:transcriptional regulator with XRE-family HTH domain